MKNVKVEGDRVALDVVLGYPARGVLEAVRKQVAERLAQAARRRARERERRSRRSSRTPCSAA